MMAIVHIDDAVAALTAEPGGNNVERIDIMSQPVNDDAIDFFEIDQDITLRRMVPRNSNPKGTVLFLHGFPETLYVWKDIATSGLLDGWTDQAERRAWFLFEVTRSA
jgi:pimeloyl-ACP methyl ester carboxylesterase